MRTTHCTRATLLAATALVVMGNSSRVWAADTPQRDTAAAPAQANPTTTDTSNANGSTADDIIVTAQKRSERLQEVPLPVSVLSASTLVASNQTRLADYFSKLPGVSLQPGAQSIQNLVVRGISTGTGNPTVGITVDDVPYGASSTAGGSFQVPDFDPGDLRQIEVLRGPQGTLYGASSLSGLLKYETVDPSTDRLSGRISGGLSAIHGGDEAGYNVRGSVNVPVSGDLAIRASGFYRRDAGWIDNPFYGQTGINADRAYGGRVSALFRPSTDLTIKLSALYQRIKGGASDDEHLDLGDQKQGYLPGATAYTRELQAYSANITGKLGPVTLTSVTGYNVNNVHDAFDLSFALGSLVKPGFGVDGFIVQDDVKNKKFSQEVRADTSIGSHVDLQVGGFYTDEQGRFAQPLLAANATNGHVVGLAALQDPHATYREYAVFGNATFKFGDQFDIQVGGRESWIKQSYQRIDTGPIVPGLDGSPSPFIIPELRTSANVFTYAVTPRFRINEHFMLYGRVASGYRAGGVNTAFGVPLSYKPDKTENYEIGAKGDLFDRVVTFDLSLYYINWKDIQLTLLTPSFQGYTGNGTKAKSEGIELAVDVHPVTGLTIGGWVAINDAELTENLPASATVVGGFGDKLPYSSPVSGNVHATYQVSLSDSLKANFGAQMNYVDQRLGTFVGAGPRHVYPDYTTLELTAGVEVDKSWSLSLYANNVTNSRGQLAPGFPSANSFIPISLATSIYRIRPREVGVTVSKSF